MGRGPIEQSNVEMMWAHVNQLKNDSTSPCYGNELDEFGILKQCDPHLVKI